MTDDTSRPPHAAAPPVTRVTRDPGKAAGAVGFLLNMGPLLVFFAAYMLSDRLSPLFGWAAHPSAAILTATAVLLPCLALAAAALWRLEGRVPPIHLVGLVLGLGFGGLTLWLQDGDFIKIKVTAVNVLLGAVLAIGLAMGRPLLRDLLGQNIALDATGWRKLTLLWMSFFFVMAVLNEIIWRTQSETFWVNYKVWGVLLLTVGLTIAQAPLIMRHQIDAEGADS